MITNDEWMNESRSRYPQRASALDFKDAIAPRFCDSDVVFELFIETHPVFQNVFSFIGITGSE